MEARVKTVAEDSSVTSAERDTPETDAVWADKSRNILEHYRNLERQRDEAVAERDAEQVARKALTKALMICIRYADSSADTEQAHAALALAAKLL
jgi:molybdenum-dependent DNA-binding transcriptional regulator ModE